MSKRELLRRMKRGMRVYDRSGREAGRIDRVRFNTDPQGAGEAAGHTPADDREWMDLVATMMEPDDARAVTLARQIWYVGYAHMRGTGLTGLRNYILPHQIAAVDEKGVHLHIDLPVPESAPQAS